MNTIELKKILDEHKVWVESAGDKSGRANLRGANLRGANLRGANLRDANLCGANLRGANLRGSDLCGANLFGANLFGANLFGANLCGANLRGSDLCDANLCGANLCDANLCGANLRGANLRGSDLCGANLRGANLRGANLPELTYIIMGEKYYVQITNGNCVKAGCQQFSIEEWRKFTKREIAEMDGKKALKFYPRLLDIIDFYTGKGVRPSWLSEPNSDDEQAA